MKKLSNVAIAAALLSLVSYPALALPPTAAPGSPLTQPTWSGVLKAGGAELRLVLHLKQEGSTLGGTIDSVDQGAIGMPLANIAYDKDELRFEVPSVDGRYAGKWDAAARKWVGTWSQSGAASPLDLSAGAPPAQIVQGLDGEWGGLLDSPAGTLRLVLHIATNSSGTAALLESPDQGPGSLPVMLSRDGDKVVVEAKGIGGRFEGAVSGNGGTINGQWTQLGRSTPLSIQRRVPGAAAPSADPPQIPN